MHNVGSNNRLKANPIRNRSPHGNSSGDSTATVTKKHKEKRTTFARSRSPAILRASNNSKATLRNRHLSPAVSRNPRHNLSNLASQNFLTSSCRIRLPLPLSSSSLVFSIDSRKLGESILLLGSLLYAAYHTTTYPSPIIPLITTAETHKWLALGNNFFRVHLGNPPLMMPVATELRILVGLSLSYLIWIHTSLVQPAVSSSSSNKKTNISVYSTSAQIRPASPRLPENRRQPLSTASTLNKSDFGYVWMSVPKNYRYGADLLLLWALVVKLWLQGLPRRRNTDRATFRAINCDFSVIHIN